jgi:hypothetical protein
MAGETTTTAVTPTEEKKDITSFKFEANISVFGTNVDLKPMEGDEIGYRAPAGEEGIPVTQTALIQSDLIEAGGLASKLIPSTTYIKAIVFNKATKKVEFAAKAMFYGPIEKDSKDYDTVKGLATETDAAKQDAKSLWNFLDVRGIVIKDINANSDFATISAACWNATTNDITQPLKDYKGFILNQYPKIFTVNSVSIYVGPKEEAAAK